jgi:hypothetical protein
MNLNRTVHMYVTVIYVEAVIYFEIS